MENFSDLQVFAKTLWGEARGEGNLGIKGVACVIMNRVNADFGNDNKPDWWGEGVRNVCLKPKQFSCWNDGDKNRPLLLAVDEKDAVYKQCLAIARRAMDGNLKDVVRGADHYFDRRSPKAPDWSVGRVPVASIKHHIFYRLRP